MPVRFDVRVEEAVHVNDEVAHMSVVDGRRGGSAPGGIGFRVAGEDTDDVKLARIDEFGRVRTNQLAAENEVKQLLVWHQKPPLH